MPAADNLKRAPHSPKLEPISDVTVCRPASRRIRWTQTSQVFPIRPNSLIATLKEEFGFYVLNASGDADSMIRLVTSWATEERHVDAFLARLTFA